MIISWPRVSFALGNASQLLISSILPSILRLALIFSTGFACHSNAQDQIAEYSAQYQANANGIAATAERSLMEISDGSYQLSNTLQATLGGQTIANLQQSSTFEIRDNIVTPSSYSYLLTGISSASNAIAYNWNALIALSTEDDESWQLELSSQVMDQLSYQFALRRNLIAGTRSDAALEFKIIDGDEIEQHQYRIMGNEVLLTPLGQLNTVKLERIRAQTDPRSTIIWLAADWEFLLARIEQVNRSGLKIELELQEAVVSGQEVTALN